MGKLFAILVVSVTSDASDTDNDSGGGEGRGEVDMLGSNKMFG